MLGSCSLFTDFSWMLKKLYDKDLKLMFGVILHMFYIEERTFSIQTELQSVS